MRILILLISLYTVNAFASYQGQWLGDGRFVTHRRAGQCDHVFLKLEESSQNFKIIYGNYSCSDIKAEYPTSVFEKSDGELYYNGELVGTYTDKQIYVSYYNKLYQLSLTKENDYIYFYENWQDDSSSLVIKATLKHVSE